jgi:hypothetical protein
VLHSIHESAAAADRGRAILRSLLPPDSRALRRHALDLFTVQARASRRSESSVSALYSPRVVDGKMMTPGAFVISVGTALDALLPT